MKRCLQCGLTRGDDVSVCSCGSTLTETRSSTSPPFFQEGAMEYSHGFFASLFDLSFSEFITTKLIKVFYVVSIIILGVLQIITIVGGYNQSKGIGYLYLILSPFIFLLGVILIRIWLEMLIVIFRIADNTRDIAQQRKIG